MDIFSGNHYFASRKRPSVNPEVIFIEISEMTKCGASLNGDPEISFTCEYKNRVFSFAFLFSSGLIEGRTVLTNHKS
jgi:hypothetical protein